MHEAPGSLQLAETEPPAPELLLLIAPNPWLRNFLRNLGDLFRSADPGPLPLESAPAAFWPDVFVDRGLPWRRFLESGAYHILALALIWAGSRFHALQPHATAQPTFTKADVVYYTPSEYLPPLDTRRPNSARARKADPEYSAQPIISVPPEADNRSQTLFTHKDVTPPNIQLQRDVALPNVVAWSGKPQLPIGPAPVVNASEITRLAPRMERSVIAPPPDLQALKRETLQTPEAAVIAPPPAVDTGSARRLGDLNIGRNTVIAPAPQLSLDEQRALPSRNSTASGRHSPQVIAPPPSLGAAGRSRAGGAMIALSLHPAVGAPPDPPAGNRRGSFAAVPEGHHGASGAAGANAGSGNANASGSGKKSSGDLPSGLYVGKAANAAATVAGDPAKSSGGSSIANTVNPNLIANARPENARPPRVSAHTPQPERLQPENDSKLSAEERAVFGNRKFYSLSLNMPNLNSAGGSWIIRFAALKPDSTPGSLAARAAAAGDPSSATSSSAASTDLSAPSATRKFDPAYPLELMRQNVGGTVILYGVIHADGTVGSVRVLRSVDDRLDQFASQAIAKWQFQPATKNGAAVDVEATFWIPFRPGKF
ncbi:MAG TPA: energy transducer TonB [Candidatus Acidoferrum sp.]|jgi:TonB family protein|nr:energy transducer TonB [Candidatus Acidoferrum sp.]